MQERDQLRPEISPMADNQSITSGQRENLDLDFHPIEIAASLYRQQSLVRGAE